MLTSTFDQRLYDKPVHNVMSYSHHALNKARWQPESTKRIHHGFGCPADGIADTNDSLDNLRLYQKEMG